jgi:hypothetical protein
MSDAGRLERLSQYFGPRSPRGPVTAGILCVVVFVLAFLILFPPMLYVGGKVFGWWWRLWLS